MTLYATLCRQLICQSSALITGARAIWRASPNPTQPRVYFANHNSHGDFVLVWAVMPPALRQITRPVAAAEYWQQSRLRRFIGHDVFRAVLIDRAHVTRDHPIERMLEVLAGGESLIVFPEGTRNTGEVDLLPFKAGLYHLAKGRPETEFIPVWINNLNRVLPKGRHIPVTLLCSVTFGEALYLAEQETKQDFLNRSRAALLSLAPQEPH